jgi:hypothetical protein
LDGINPDWRPEARSHPERANLCGADLENADLSGATLFGADLEDVYLSGADLSRADLVGADLEHAILSGATLFEADLTSADLRHANLLGVKVSKAKLRSADLTDATYAPRSEPPDPDVVGIRGLSTVHAEGGEEIGLVQLRKLLQDAGLRDDERAVTCSIERNRTYDQLWYGFSVAGVLRFVAFDITTAYGLHPVRALGWIVLLGAALTPVYMRAILHPTETNGIVQVFPEDRLDGTAGDPAAEKERKKTVVQASTWQDALRPAAYFSLISAANIGFEQFTPGDWIRRLQGREYSLEAVGWVRRVAGSQALLSVFLLAMWALTQFGRPFG